MSPSDRRTEPLTYAVSGVVLQPSPPHGVGLAREVPRHAPTRTLHSDSEVGVLFKKCSLTATRGRGFVVQLGVFCSSFKINRTALRVLLFNVSILLDSPPHQVPKQGGECVKAMSKSLLSHMLSSPPSPPLFCLFFYPLISSPQLPSPSPLIPSFLPSPLSP